MDEARTQFQMVYNSGFRHRQKSALNKTEQPETSKLFLRANTPLPYPAEGLKDSNDEDEEEGDEGEEAAEEEGEPDKSQEESRPAPSEMATNAPGLGPNL